MVKKNDNSNENQSAGRTTEYLVLRSDLEKDSVLGDNHTIVDGYLRVFRDGKEVATYNSFSWISIRVR